jgi:predicted DNA binding protein
MRYFDLHVSQLDWMLHPMQEFIRREHVVEYKELITWNLMPGSDVEYELFYVVADLEPYREQIETVDSIHEFTITTVSEDAFYVYACQETRDEDRAFRSAFGDMELVVVPPIVFDAHADLHFTLVGIGENLEPVLAEMPPDIEVTVEEIGQYDHRHEVLAGRLTDRQREAVRAALDLGYYETPREATLDDVAAALNCASSTASTLLNRAEAAVMDAVVDRPGH